MEKGNGVLCQGVLCQEVAARFEGHTLHLQVSDTRHGAVFVFCRAGEFPRIFREDFSYDQGAYLL